MNSNEQTVQLAELQQNITTIIKQLQMGINQRDSRIVLTQSNQPIAVLQTYAAYQELLTLLEEIQHRLHITEVQSRIYQMKKGAMNSIPLDEILSRSHSKNFTDSTTNGSTS